MSSKLILLYCICRLSSRGLQCWRLLWQCVQHTIDSWLWDWHVGLYVHTLQCFIGSCIWLAPITSDV